jgi:hypothetical protein
MRVEIPSGVILRGLFDGFGFGFGFGYKGLNGLIRLWLGLWLQRWTD